MKAFCPFCEKEYDNLEVQTKTEITTLNGVTAAWQKKYIVCPDCGEELYNGKLHDENLQTLYAACKVSNFAKPIEDLCDYVLKLRTENAELRERLDKAIELPRVECIKTWEWLNREIVGDIMLEWCALYKKDGYIVAEPCLSKEAAEARLKGIKEKVNCTRAKLDEGLPVRIGDPAWYVVKKSVDSWIVPTSVTEITICEDKIVVNLKNTPRRLVFDYNGEIIGNYYEIYLDKDSAEARLKEIKESED